MKLTNNIDTTNWRFIKDIQSTNTAENFLMLRKLLDENNYDEIFVVTSEFHYERAKMFTDIIIPENNFKWILGLKEQSHSRDLEKLFMKNVNADIEKALAKFT